MQLYHFQKGLGPLMLVFPTSGTFVPQEIRDRLVALPQQGAWRLPQLFDVELMESAAVVAANLASMVVDLNAESPQEVVKIDTQGGDPWYQAGAEPDDRECLDRKEHFFEPFFQCVRTEADRLIRKFGHLKLLWVVASSGQDSQFRVRISGNHPQRTFLQQGANAAGFQVETHGDDRIPLGLASVRSDAIQRYEVHVPLPFFLERDGEISPSSQQRFIQQWEPVWNAIGLLPGPEQEQ